MSEAIIVALVSGGLTLAGTVITVILSHRSTIATLEKQSALADQEIKGQLDVVNTKIETLSSRVEKHNQVIDRTYQLERRADVLEEKVKVANNRIKDLEKGGASDD